MTKTGRNDPCACGSGIKFKKCCLTRRPTLVSIPSGQRQKPQLPRQLMLENLDPTTPENAKMIRDFTERSQRAHFGPPDLIRIELNGWVMRAFGGTLTWRKPTETFHEFCAWVVLHTLGQAWYEKECAVPQNSRHAVARWHRGYLDLQKREIPSNHKRGEIASALASGNAQELILFGRDLLYLTQIGRLPEPLLERLRNRNEFQGAWYEVRVASALIHGGFEIEWLDKKSESHCELTARHSFTGETFAVEAKSKRRPGFLNESGASSEELRVKAHRNFSDALNKDAQGLPLLVFVDVNMPLSESFDTAAVQWANHMAEHIAPMGSSPSDSAKFAYAVCTNFSFHQRGDETVSGLAVVYDKIPMFSVNPTKYPDLMRHACEEGLKHVGALPNHTL